MSNQRLANDPLTFREMRADLQPSDIGTLALAVQAGRSTRAACQVPTPQSSMHSMLTGISTWTPSCTAGVTPVRQPGTVSFQASSSPGQAQAISNGRGRHVLR